MSSRWDQIRALQRTRPRSTVVRVSVGAFGGLVALSWSSGVIEFGELFRERRWSNVRRFVTEDALPAPLRESGASLGALFDWAGDALAGRGLEATASTLGISVLAIVLAAVFAGALVPFAVRTLATCDPFLVDGSKPSERCWHWALVVAATRLVLVVLRAVPEYVLAFLLLAVLGPSAWPLVLALALHNTGILGRLGAETIENLDRGPLRSLRMLGASRRQLVVHAAWPLSLPRFLLYFFYRFETCVREATVLGMLGVASLGYWITESRARQEYDVMLLFVALGAGLVLLADVASMVCRSWVRRAS